MHNMILATDSYKHSHFLQYPPEARVISAYAEARANDFSDVVLFLGLQPFLVDYLSKPVTAADVDEAEAICTAHGVPFNRTGWDAIVAEYGGFLPIEINTNSH
jgi:nicotinamide phosphoribosyltransferase